MDNEAKPKRKGTNPRGNPGFLIPFTKETARAAALKGWQKRRDEIKAAEDAILKASHALREGYGEERTKKVRAMLDKLDSITAKEITRNQPDIERLDKLASVLSKFTDIELKLRRDRPKQSSASIPQPVVLGADNGENP